MAHFTCFFLLAIALSVALVNGAPQFGGFGQASAQAQAGGFGYPRPPIYPGGGFGPRPPIFGGRGFGRHGGAPSINISKSVSISAGGRGGAQSSAGSFGK